MNLAILTKISFDCEKEKTKFEFIFKKINENGILKIEREFETKEQYEQKTIEYDACESLSNGSYNMQDIAELLQIFEYKFTCYKGYIPKKQINKIIKDNIGKIFSY